MDILFLTAALPYPPLDRSRLRAYYVLRYLAERHTVRLVSFVGEESRPEHIAHMEAFCQQVLTVANPHADLNLRGWLQSILTNRPVGVMHNGAAAMEALLARLMVESPPDAVHADQTVMARYALAARKAYSGEDAGPRLVLDAHRAMHHLLRLRAEAAEGLARPVWQREAALYTRYEATLVQRFDQLLTMTAADKGALLHLLPETEATTADERLTVVPLAIDPQATPPVAYEDQGPHILFLGNFFWPPSGEGVRWFVESVLPLVLQQVPDAHLTIVGRQPPPAVQSLAGAPTMTGAHVEVTDFVPDPLPYWRRSRAFIVPLLQPEGIQAKVLDAWLHGVPIVSTQSGVQGLAIRPGQTNLVANDAPAFAEAVVALLTQPGMREGLVANGRDWVEKQYDWRTLYRDLDAIYS